MEGNTALTHVRLFGEGSFTAAAYCKARQALPLEVLESLLLRLNGMTDKATAGMWCGRRTVLLDGTSASMPDTQELREYFGYPGGQKPGLGFPLTHMLCLFDHATGCLLEKIIAPRATNDLEGLPDTLRFMREKDVLVADRAFGCFLALVLCIQRKADAVLRLNSHVLVDFTPGRPHDDSRPVKPAGTTKRVRRKGKRKAKVKGRPKSRWVRSLGEQDQIVAYPKSRMKSSLLSQEEWDALPNEIEVREIRFHVDQPECRVEEITLVTTLLDPVEFPKQKIIELYLARWAVEGNIRDLKQTLKMDVLKGKSVDVVKKELVMHIIAYNLIQCVRLFAAKVRQVTRERISFVDAMRWLAWSRNPKLLSKLIVNPHRPGRVEPRKTKRRPKTHGLLTRPRWEFKAEIRAQLLAKSLTKQQVAA